MTICCKMKYRSSETRSMCLHISALGARHVMSFHLSILRLPTETLQPLSPSILCYSQAAIYNIQMISQRVEPNSQRLLHCRTQILPLLSPTQTHSHLTRWRCAEKKEVRMTENAFLVFFVLHPNMCGWGSVSPVWIKDGGQITCYRTEGRSCEHFHHKRRLHSHWSSFFFISTMKEGNYGHCTFYYVVGQLCL